VGYSAVGGQTLNPYGPMVYESGGSSSGSGAAMAARYAVAAVGTETSGSILSPSAQNALVGLKPTVGLISRSGIVPISTSLDTPGPMTLNLLDNMILFAAMMGRDAEDPRSVELEDFMVAMQNKIGKIRLGMPSMLLRDSSILVWAQSLNQGNLEIIALEEPSPALDGFRSILDGEMPQALAHYFEKYAHGSFRNWTLDTLIIKNQTDKALFAPYGQQLFEHMALNSLSDQEVETIFQNLQKVSQAYFSRQKETLKLDAFLSINNYHAALAAVAHAPCLTLPLGRRPHGEPFNLTLIGESKEEKRLFEIGWMLESMLASRGYPDLYRN
jgi:amidase